MVGVMLKPKAPPLLGRMTDARVAEAMRRAKRAAFLPSALADEANVDHPLPIGEGQTISAPHMVAIMAEALDVHEGHRVLEVGSGSGWHAAVLAILAGPGHVVTIERHESLARAARERLAPFGVEVVAGDGSKGLPERAPFDRISVAAAAPRVPKPLLDQLAAGGILVLPVETRGQQTLTRVRKLADGRIQEEDLMPVVFVPLIGEYGFPE